MLYYSRNLNPSFNSTTAAGQPTDHHFKADIAPQNKGPGVDDYAGVLTYD